MQTSPRKSHRLASLVGAILATTVLVASASPHVQVGPGAEVAEDGLHRIDGAAIANAWAKPGVDLSGYTQVRLLPAEMTFREVKDPGLDRSASDYPLDDERREKIGETIREAFVTELGKSKRFALTDQPGPGVLEIRGAVLDVVSHVPEQPIGRGAVFVKSLGEATLVVELRDSITHEVLARAFERRAAESAFPTRSNSVSNLAEISNAAHRWADLMRRRLEAFAVL
jgi:uncharacterized protein DUF3313